MAINKLRKDFVKPDFVKPDLWLLLGIFLISCLMRLWAAHVPINVDEHKWMSRGLKFLKAILDLNLADTYKQHHPGVLSMWVNSAGMMLHCLLRDWFPSALKLDQGSFQGCAQTLIPLPFFPVESYVFTRILQAMITSASMVALFVLTRQLLGSAIALLSIGLLSFEPFFVAYQRLQVTEAFQTNFTALSLIALLLYLRGKGDRRMLIGSGVSMGLAVVTKTITLTVLPAIAAWLVLIECGVWRAAFARRGLMRQAVDMVIWGVAIAATFFIVFPAMWVAPIHTLTRMLNDLMSETERGYLFFLGQLTDSPGPLFYPIVLLYRLSPLLHVGLALCLIALCIPKLRRQLPHVPELLALLIISLSVLLVISETSNKIDRYIMLVIPPLSIVAAAGWLQALRWLTQRSRSSNGHSLSSSSAVLTPLHLALIAGLTLLQLGVAAPHIPYFLTYFNPLLGGPAAAERLLMLGIGEGLDQVATHLNRLPNIKETTIGAWYLPAFAAYSDTDKVVEIGKLFTTEDERRWIRESNLLVFYVNQYQRQLPSPELLEYFNAQKPLDELSLYGVTYAQVFPGAIALPSTVKALEAERPITFGDTFKLRGYEVDHLQASAGDELMVTLYWEVLKQPPADINVAVTLAGSDRQPAAQVKSPPIGGFLRPDEMTTGMLLRDLHRISVPAKLSPGSYDIDITLESASQPAAIALPLPAASPTAPDAAASPAAPPDPGSTVSPTPAPAPIPDTVIGTIEVVP
ncbi:MAG TPA: glycosyltransferase family 39 protein [Chroococcidiopsis sp.]